MIGRFPVFDTSEESLVATAAFAAEADRRIANVGDGSPVVQLARSDPQRTGAPRSGVPAPHPSRAQMPGTRPITLVLLVILGEAGGLDPRTGLASAARYVSEFFHVHLRGAPRAALYSGPLVAGARFETK